MRRCPLRPKMRPGRQRTSELLIDKRFPVFGFCPRKSCQWPILDETAQLSWKSRSSLRTALSGRSATSQVALDLFKSVRFIDPGDYENFGARVPRETSFRARSPFLEQFLCQIAKKPSPNFSNWNKQTFRPSRYVEADGASGMMPTKSLRDSLGIVLQSQRFHTIALIHGLCQMVLFCPIRDRGRLKATCGAFESTLRP